MTELLKDNQELIIRKASPDDATSFNEFLRKIIVETDHFGFEPDELTITDEQQAHTIGMFAKASNAIMLLATVDDKIVGSISFRSSSSKKFLHVGEFGVQVLKDYWNLGIGKELIKRLISWAKENEMIYKISLRVRSDNQSAIHLYKKLGFEEEGLLRGEMKCSGKLYDLVYMGLIVK